MALSDATLSLRNLLMVDWNTSECRYVALQDTRKHGTLVRGMRISLGNTRRTLRQHAAHSERQKNQKNPVVT